MPICAMRFNFHAIAPEEQPSGSEIWSDLSTLTKLVCGGGDRWLWFGKQSRQKRSREGILGRGTAKVWGPERKHMWGTEALQSDGSTVKSSQVNLLITHIWRLHWNPHKARQKLLHRKSNSIGGRDFVLDPGPQLPSSVSLAKLLKFPELRFQSKIKFLMVQCTQVSTR